MPCNIINYLLAIQLKVVFFITAMVLLLSCHKASNPQETLPHCTNELRLLSGMDSIPMSDYSLFHIRDSIDGKLAALMDNYNCRNVKFRVNFEIDSVHNLPIALYCKFYEACEDIPPFNPFVNWLHIYLTASDTLLIRSMTCPTDSVKAKVLWRYHDKLPEDLRRVYLALLWDKEANRESFRKVISGCIEGYLEVANMHSQQLFTKAICELNATQLDSLAYHIPFHLRTDFIWPFDTIDFAGPLLNYEINEEELYD